MTAILQRSKKKKTSNKNLHQGSTARFVLAPPYLISYISAICYSTEFKRKVKTTTSGCFILFTQISSPC